MVSYVSAQYRLTTLIVAGIASLPAVPFFAVAVRDDVPRDRVAVAGALGLVVALVGVIAAWRALLVGVRVGPDGIRSRAFWRTQRVRWPDVSRLGYGVPPVMSNAAGGRICVWVGRNDGTRVGLVGASFHVTKDRAEVTPLLTALERYAREVGVPAPLDMDGWAAQIAGVWSEAIARIGQDMSY